MKSICVFCGSSSGRKPSYAQAAREVGRLMASRGIRLVYGGGNVGLMGIVADAVLEAGGKALGVIPEALVKKEIAHQALTELRVVGSMHERKALMADLSDGFLALPGGFGTFEEFCEVLTWSQLGLHKKACGLLNVEGYYDPLIAMFDHAVAEKFVKPSNRELVLADTDPAALLEAVLSSRVAAEEKWIGRGER